MFLSLDNTIALAMVRSALFMFYLVEGVQLLMFHKPKETFRTMLGCVLLLWSFELLKDGISQFYPWFTLSSMRRIYLLFDLLAIPLCLSFVMSLIYKHWVTTRRILLHLAPFVLFLLLYILIPNKWIYGCGLAFPALYGFVMLRKIGKELEQYNRLLEDNYSYQEKIDVKWLKKVVVLFIGNLIFCIFVYGSPYSGIFYIYYAYCLAMWIYILYQTHIHHRPALISDAGLEREERREASGEENSHETTEASKHWIGLLDHCFVEEKIYLQPFLNMQDVATRVGTNRTYLSKYLNDRLHVTFYEYVNNYRLDYAKKLIEETTLTIGEVSQKSGFNSFSTFLRSFKQRYGCTPNFFRADKEKKKK